MSKSEKQKFQEEYQKYLAAPVANNRTIEPDSPQAASLIKLMNSEYGKKELGYDAYAKALREDFSSFEQASPALRNYLASCYMKNVDKTQPGLLDLPLDNPRLQQFLENNSMNPAFRLGCSLRQHTEGYNSKNYMLFDDYMNSHIMQRTLSPMDSTQIENLKTALPNQKDLSAAISQNIEKQVMVARTLFLGHLGNTTLKNYSGKKEPIQRSMASMAAHCSRTAYVFKPGAKGEVSRLMDALTGKGLGDAAGVERRTAATHSVANGKTIDSFQEKKVLPASFSNQHGMDIAIGGLGNPGIPGPGGRRQLLKNDGSCGHMYMRADPGSKDRCTSLLIGFESDSPSAGHNQQGHKHTMTAKPEYMSSFLGQRTDEMGAKYGGRVVDCTSMDLKGLTSAVDDFSNYYRAMLIEGMKNPEARRQIEHANVCLSGVPMEGFTLSDTLANIGMPPNRASEIAHLSVKARNITGAFMNPEESKVKVQPVQEPPHPGSWTRFKAFFGSKGAKDSLHRYNAHCHRLEETAAKAPARPAGPDDEWTTQYKFHSIGTKINTFARFLAKSDRAAEPMTVRDLEHEQNTAARQAAPQKKAHQEKTAAKLDPLPRHSQKPAEPQMH